MQEIHINISLHYSIHHINYSIQICSEYLKPQVYYWSFRKNNRSVIMTLAIQTQFKVPFIY